MPDGYELPKMSLSQFKAVLEQWALNYEAELEKQESPLQRLWHWYKFLRG